MPYIGTILVEDGVKSVGNSAFAACSSLTKIRIAKTVKIIGEAAFKKYSQLRVVDFAKGSQLKEMKKGSFIGIAATELVIPDSVTKIGQDVFQFCGSLSCVTLGDNCRDIGCGAFAFCDQLFTVVYQGNCEPACKENVFEADSLEPIEVSKNYYGKTAYGIPVKKVDDINSVCCCSKQDKQDERLTNADEKTEKDNELAQSAKDWQRVLVLQELLG